MAKPEEIVTDLLGSPSKVKILALLCSNPKREYSLGEIVKHTKLCFKTVSTTIRIFKKYGIIRERRYGPAKLISINTQNPLAKKIIRLFEGET